MKFLKKTEFKIFITVFLVLLFYTSHYGGSYMADSMLAVTQGIVDNGEIKVDSYVKEDCLKGIQGEGLYGCDYAFYEGHWYSGFPPGASFLALPVYVILKPFTYLIPDFVFNRPKVQIQTILLNILATILIVIPLAALLSVLIYKFTESFVYNKKYRIISALLFSFGTLFFWYSTNFSTRILATFFSFTAFYILFKNRTKRISLLWLFVAGFFAATAVTMEYMQFIVFGILSLYLFSFLRDKRLLYFIFGGAIPILLMLLYNYLAFDSVFNIGYHFMQGLAQGNMDKSLFGSFSLHNLWSYTFSSKYGLFFYMPILFLSIYGLYLGFKKRGHFWREFSIISLIFLSYLFVISSFITESSCTFGPRYLIILIPFMFLSLPLAVKKLGLFITLIFGGISVFINYLPALYLIEHTGCKAGLVVIKKLLLQIPKKGFTNYTFNLINQELMSLNYILVNIFNIFGLGIIIFILYKVWKI